MMRPILLALFCAVTAACTTTEKDDAFFIACASIPTADALFQTYAASGKVSADVIRKKEIAVAAAQSICDGPRPTDTRAAALAVQRAMTAVLTVIATAKKQAGA